MEKKIKKTWIILGSILALLIIARLMLPYFVTRYVNKVLSEIPGYSGSISDVDIALIRGAYVVKDLKIFKVDGNAKVPFVDILAIDLSVEWKALFDGAIVGEIIFEKPIINFIGGDGKGEKKTASDNQYGGNVDWTEPIKKLLPLQINRLEIQQGTISYFDFTTKPKVDVSLKNLQVLATNLNNAKDVKEKLPSNVNASATSIGGGKLQLNMAINLLKEIPDLDMDMKFEGINMPSLNDFFLAYSKVDIERGTFNLYSELVVDNSNIRGYVKPIAKNVKVLNFKKDKQDLGNLLWQSVVGLLAEVFENQKKDQFATQIPLEGNLKNIKTAVWPTIWNVLRNAFVQAFKMNTDDAVNLMDPDKPKPEEKSKREERKEKREKRREEKKEQEEKEEKKNK
ncbi:MAG: DUF748 domain-containing protein [Chryseolinea sp.]